MTIDPLASLAEQQEQLRQRLMEITPVDSGEFELAWQAAADALLEPPNQESESRGPTIVEQYMILVTCRDEKEQVELLLRFQEQGLQCKALLS